LYHWLIISGEESLLFFAPCLPLSHLFIYTTSNYLYSDTQNARRALYVIGKEIFQLVFIRYGSVRAVVKFKLGLLCVFFFFCALHKMDA
jgi:hypothetical protein